MGFFSNNEQRSMHANNTYHEFVREYLKEKDGKQHVIFIHTPSKHFNKGFGADEKVTLEIDEILSEMQEDEDEILDIQFSTIKEHGTYLKDSNESYQTMIRYQ